MAKKVKRATRALPDKASRWTVRGVAVPLQRSAGDAARARGLTLGQWLSEVVEGALADQPERQTTVAGSWRETVEARLARLEELAGANASPAAGPGESR